MSEIRLIDANALKKALKSNCTMELCHDYKNAWCLACCPHNEFEDLIDEAPTIEEKSYAMGYQDGAEGGLQGIRTEGKWIEDSGNIACSHCHTIWLYRKTDFCPNCGADLRKGGNK